MNTAFLLTEHVRKEHLLFVSTNYQLNRTFGQYQHEAVGSTDLCGVRQGAEPRANSLEDTTVLTTGSRSAATPPQVLY